LKLVFNQISKFLLRTAKKILTKNMKSPTAQRHTLEDLGEVPEVEGVMGL
jgi:hypothetical protein